MKGWKTVLFNGLGVIGVSLLTWATGINWTDYVSPTVAGIIIGAANIGLRLITTTPVGKTS